MQGFYRKLAVLGVFLLGLTGCGGGDGDSGNGSTSTPASVGATTTAATVNVMTMALDAINLTPAEVTTSSSRPVQSSSLMDAVAQVQNRLHTLRTTTVTPLQANPCDISGTVTVTLGTTGFTVLFEACREEEFPGVETFRDGMVTYEETASGFSLTISGLVERQTRLVDSRLISDDFLDLAFTGVFDATTPCLGNAVPTAFTIRVNGTASEIQDEDADGVLDTNERATFTAFTMAFTIRELDDGCEPIDFSVTVSGSATDTDNLNPSNSISMAIPASGWVLDFVSMAVGASLTINGTVSIVSSCFTGDVTLETITPLFLPDDGSDCPTAGEIVLTGDQSATLAFTASGGLAVDEGSDGTIDVTFVDCEDAESCM